MKSLESRAEREPAGSLSTVMTGGSYRVKVKSDRGKARRFECRLQRARGAERAGGWWAVSIRPLWRHVYTSRRGPAETIRLSPGPVSATPEWQRLKQSPLQLGKKGSRTPQARSALPHGIPGTGQMESSEALRFKATRHPMPILRCRPPTSLHRPATVHSVILPIVVQTEEHRGLWIAGIASSG